MICHLLSTQCDAHPIGLFLSCQQRATISHGVGCLLVFAAVGGLPLEELPPIIQPPERGNHDAFLESHLVPPSPQDNVHHLC